ncbi:hypothetical protein LUD75_00395 [Epilithonimonas sp. JDS]|uniref:hypothetical protein n=1 Tax=Epilithonimonas sp. JDS TaxID=2902797 RepID=UPI001E48E309|nr:hypothetical protein [Epilithonimonas sp. JDS]MCD9853147.1 hypothetical protein [Epilithonimonas sp. JDS]
MNFRKNILRLRKKERYSKFGIYKDIPKQKVFRQSRSLFWLILICSLALFFYIYRTNNSDKAYEPAMAVVVYSIFAFGYLIKFILNLFFPELILNEKGLKFLGRKLIDWKEIRKVKIDYGGNSKIMFVVTKNNSKKIIENLNLTNIDELKISMRSYLKKFCSKKVLLK